MNREQCEGCAFFKASRCDPDAIKFCHYMYQTGQRRKVGENEICLSRKESNITQRKSFTIKKSRMNRKIFV